MSMIISISIKKLLNVNSDPLQFFEFIVLSIIEIKDNEERISKKKLRQNLHGNNQKFQKSFMMS
ncbi:unnamed protein product [Paramecium octaurelia]|uniref:Uncharacterized protein n=1 Tax=Paramecium octaurelia TaxID=43137 RepID=A0A8S1XI25_PAROT|nr:unnamed protein product [Paramecium octaurelia]